MKVLASYLCLLSTQLPKEDDVLEYQTALANHGENGWITREDFIHVKPHLIHKIIFSRQNHSLMFLSHLLIQSKVLY